MTDNPFTVPLGATTSLGAITPTRSNHKDRASVPERGHDSVNLSVTRTQANPTGTLEEAGTQEKELDAPYRENLGLIAERYLSHFPGVPLSFSRGADL